MNPVFVFFLSPLLSYLSALKNIRVRGAILALLLIGSFIGFLLNTENRGYDLYRYLEMLNNSKTFDAVINSFRNGEEVDLYAPLIVSIVGSITHNGHILMMVFGTIFGFLYAKSLSRCVDAKDIISYSLIFMFANIYGYNGLGGVRFATAFYVLFFGVTGYVSTPNIKNLLIIFSSALIHFGMLPGIALFLTYLLVKKWPMAIYIATIISFLFTFIDIGSIISKVAPMLGSGLSNRAEIYSSTNDTYVKYLQENSENVVWFIKYRTDIAMSTITLFLLYITIYRKRFKLNSFTKEILLFILTLLTFRNLVSNVPDLGIRYTLVFIAFFLFFAYNLFIANRKSSKYISVFLMLGCALCPIYAIRQLFDYVGILDIILPPVYGIIANF